MYHWDVYQPGADLFGWIVFPLLVLAVGVVCTAYVAWREHARAERLNAELLRTRDRCPGAPIAEPTVAPDGR